MNKYLRFTLDLNVHLKNIFLIDNIISNLKSILFIKIFCGQGPTKWHSEKIFCQMPCIATLLLRRMYKRLRSKQIEATRNNCSIVPCWIKLNEKNIIHVFFLQKKIILSLFTTVTKCWLHWVILLNLVL